MRRLLALLLLLAAPAWGQVASREFENSEGDTTTTAGDVLDIGTSDITVCAWWKLESDTDAWHIIADKRNGSADGWTFLFDDSAARVSFRLGGTTRSNAYTRPADGVWWFYCGTMDRDVEACWYVDGALATICNGMSDATDYNNAGTLSVGSKYDDAAHWLDGLLAYVHVYIGRVLSLAEIQQIMHCPGSVTDGLSAYWPMTDSDSQYDLSGAGNTLTNGGTAASTDGPPISTNCAGAGGN